MSLTIGPNIHGLATAIHNTLIHFCAATPDRNYRSGVFAREITPTVPVLDCLAYLSSSVHTSPAEKKVFSAVHSLLFSLMLQEAAGRSVSAREMSRHVPVVDNLIDIFEADQRNRGVFQLQEKMAMSVPGNYTGEAGDYVSMLLQTTGNVLVQGCASAKGYRGGIFRAAVTPSTHILTALGTLSSDTGVSPAEIGVFAEAKTKVRKLLELQMLGVKRVEVPGGVYREHKAWFSAMLGVFERDFERRGVPKPEWDWYGALDDPEGR